METFTKIATAWINFLFASPKRTTTIFVVVIIAYVIIAPGVLAYLSALLYGFLLNAVLPLAIMVFGLMIVWNAITGNKGGGKK